MPSQVPSDPNPAVATALAFDGRDGAVTLGPAGALRLTRRSFTAEAWVRLGGGDGTDLPIFGTDETAQDLGLHLVVRDRVPHFGFYANDTPGRTRLPVAAWVHLAFRYNLDSGEQAILVNGEVDARSEGHGPFLGSGIVRLGRWARDFRFQGEMTEVRLWSRALSRGEIASGMFRRASGREPGLTACWPLDDGGGEVARNLRQEHPAMLGSGAGWVEAPAAGFVRPGGRVADLPGGGADVAIPHGPDLDLTRKDDFTVELWVAVRTEEQTGAQEQWLALIGKQPETGAFPFSIQMHGGEGRLRAARSDGSEASAVETGRSIGDGKWHQVALVKAGPDLILYLDGGKEAQAPDTSTGRVGNTESLRIGSRHGTGHSLVGQVSEVRLWDHARSPGEIAAVAGARLRGDERGLAGYWPLDDGAGEIGRDGRLRPPAQLAGPTWLPQSGVPLLARDLESAPTAPVLAFGGGDHLAVPEARALDFPDGLSVEAWVRPGPATGSLWRFPLVSAHGSASGFELRCSGQGAAMMVTLDRAHHAAGLETGLETGRWSHLAGTWDGKRVALYVNGVLEASQAVAGAYTPYPAELRIGQSSFWTDRGFTGEVAEIRLWQRALTGEEVVRGVFGRVDPAAARGLLAYWPLDAGRGAMAADRAELGRFPGKIAGAEWLAAELPPRLPVAAAGDVDQVDRAARAEELERRNAELESELERGRRRIAALELQQRQAVEAESRLRAEIGALEARVTALAEAEDALASERRRRRDLESAIDTGRQQAGAVSLAALIRNTNREIEAARGELAARGGAYRLGRVAMELRMLPGPGGSGAIFPSSDAMQALGSEQLSRLELDFETESPPAVPEPEPTPVPDVRGRTETLARRRLAEAGMLAETSYQAVHAVGPGISQVGRVVTQLPPAGVEAAPNTTVRIFIGQES